MAEPVQSARRPRAVRIDITMGTLLRIALVVACAWLAVQLLPVVLVIVIGLMIAGMLAPMVSWLEGKRVRRPFAIAIVFATMVLASVVFVALTVPRLVAQLADILDSLPKAQSALGEYLQGHRWSAPLAQTVKGTRVSEWIANGARIGLGHSPQIVEVVGGAVTAAFLALYLLIDRDRMRGALFALVPRAYHVRLSRVLLGLETIVGGYMRGQVITSALMAAFTFAVLAVARVPNAVVLAVFAGAADVLPYVGGIMATGPAVLAALVHGPTVALAVLGAMVAYQEFESRFIVPRVYGNVLRLPSAVVIIALVAGWALLGILGALLALPVAAAIRMVVEELRLDLPGEGAEDKTQRKRDERGEKEYAARADGIDVASAAAIASEIAHVQVKEDASDLVKAEQV